MTVHLALVPPVIFEPRMSGHAGLIFVRCEGLSSVKRFASRAPAAGRFAAGKRFSRLLRAGRRSAVGKGKAL